MIRINLMPAEERSQKARRTAKVKKPRAGFLMPLAILAGVVVLVLIYRTFSETAASLLMSSAAPVCPL